MKRDSSITAASPDRDGSNAGHCPPFCGLGAGNEIADRLKGSGIRLQEQQPAERSAAQESLHRV